MWLIYALTSLFVDLISILAKCGINKTGSTNATTLRAIVVTAFLWLMVLVTHKNY